MLAFICLLFFAILFLLVFCKTKTTENYGFVMGTTGTRKNEYYNCISKCEREDLSKKLGPTHGNLFCAEFCDSKMTDAVRYNKPEPIIATRFDYCNLVCGTENEGQFCRENCHCSSEVNEKCRIECAYSNMPVDICMSQCAKSMGPNCSTLSWNFK